jgi:hypothetical protein
MQINHFSKIWTLKKTPSFFRKNQKPVNNFETIQFFGRLYFPAGDFFAPILIKVSFHGCVS